MFPNDFVSVFDLITFDGENLSLKMASLIGDEADKNIMEIMRDKVIREQTPAVTASDGDDDITLNTEGGNDTVTLIHVGGIISGSVNDGEGIDTPNVDYTDANHPTFTNNRGIEHTSTTNGEVADGIDDITFTTPLSQFRNGADDSDLVRPNFADRFKFIEVTNTGDELLQISSIDINAPDVSQHQSTRRSSAQSTRNRTHKLSLCSSHRGRKF